MTNARASRTSESSEEKPIRPIRDPSIEPPEVYKPTAKAPGSKVLRLGRWYQVADDGSLDPID